MSGKTIVQSDRLSKPTGVFSQAVLVPAGRELLFMSGLVSKNEKGEIVRAGEAGPQTRRILENMRVLLAQVGASLDDLIKVTIFVTDIKDFNAINDVRREFFLADPPASSMVEVAALAGDGVCVEIEGLAVVPIKSN